MFRGLGRDDEEDVADDEDGEDVADDEDAELADTGCDGKSLLKSSSDINARQDGRGHIGKTNALSRS